VSIIRGAENVKEKEKKKEEGRRERERERLNAPLAAKSPTKFITKLRLTTSNFSSSTVGTGKSKKSHF
jgi:hypothetical protein